MQLDWDNIAPGVRQMVAACKLSETRLQEGNRSGAKQALQDGELCSGNLVALRGCMLDVSKSERNSAPCLLSREVAHPSYLCRDPGAKPEV